MGCGNEISDWDDKAVQDSLEGKNSGPDPEMMKEAAAYTAVKEILQEKTDRFEKSGVVQDKDMVRAIAYVPLAREIATELGIKSIEFKEDLGQRGFSLMDKGAVIFIGPVNVNKEEYQRTLFHEVGELYFKEVLPLEKVQQWEKMRENTEASFKYLPEIEKGNTQHHFAERFAEYCLGTLNKDSGMINYIREKYPDQMKTFDDLKKVLEGRLKI